MIAIRQLLRVKLFYQPRSFTMTFTVANISPIIALIAGILILVMPGLLNYIVALYLIVIGLIGLNGIYHFVN
jgi:hypothetical protein